jgi:hypothetical protein
MALGLAFGLLALIIYAFSRAHRTARNTPTMAGRFGLVVHWGSLIIAAVLLGGVVFILTKAQPLNGVAIVVAMGLVGAAVVVWLLGKAVRFVLTGPAKETTRPHGPSVDLRRAHHTGKAHGAPHRTHKHIARGIAGVSGTQRVIRGDTHGPEGQHVSPKGSQEFVGGPLVRWAPLETFGATGLHTLLRPSKNDTPQSVISFSP